MKKMILGVAAIEQSEWPPFGKQRFFFEEMVISTEDLNLNYFFFSPLEINNLKGDISGWKFKNGIWIKTVQEMPHIIYDRSFSSSPEVKNIILEFRNLIKQKNIKVLNPVDFGFLLDNKRAFHQYLLKNNIPTLETYEAELLSDPLLFDTFIAYYLKPNQGSGGIGIYVLEKKDNGFYCYNNTNTEQVFFEKNELLYQYLKKRICFSDYFLQKKAEVVRLENAITDLRVLVQNHGFNDYKITGQALRVGQENSKVSNLQSGGRAVDFEELVELISAQLFTNKKKLTDSINEIVKQCCEKLHRDFGNFFETGIDLLLTKEGPIVLEANTRPSRWVFNMIADSNPEKSEFHRSIRRLSVRMPGVFCLKIGDEPDKSNF